MKVSIILPTYNSENTIGKTIESILEQTLSDEYKLIIINDGSTDMTEKVCQKYVRENEHLIEYYNIPNNGVSNARNIGIQKANTKYIMFIDSDDIYKNDMVEKMVKQIENGRIDLVTCGYTRKMISIKKERKVNLQDFETKNKCEYIEELQKKDLFNQVWNKIYKLDIIKNNSIKFEDDISMGEDLRFNLQYIKYSKMMTFYAETLYTYNISENGLNFSYRKNMMYVKLDNVEIQRSLYEENSYDKKYIYELYVLTCLSGLSNIVKNVNKKEALVEIEYFMNNVKIQEELNKIKTYENLSIKIRLIIGFLKAKNIHILYYISKITIILKKIYRKIYIE